MPRSRERCSRAAGPARDIVLVNAAAALVAAGKSADFKEGVLIAEESIDRGAALEKMKQLERFTSQRRADPRRRSKA